LVSVALATRHAAPATHDAQLRISSLPNAGALMQARLSGNNSPCPLFPISCKHLEYFKEKMPLRVKD
jgi:hypothetical protein